MSDKPILTVAIPTYNRASSLGSLLDQLSKEKNQDLRIIVSDNDSSDDTMEIVTKYQKKISNLQYNKNPKNLGFAGNILKLYKLANTRYIWFLSDDDILLPGAIDKILDSLNRYKGVVTIFNHIWIDPYGRKMEDGVKKDIVYNNIEEFNDYNALLRTAFISIIVVQKIIHPDILKKSFDQKNHYFNLSICLLLLSKKFRFVEVAFPIVFRNPVYQRGEFFEYILTSYLNAIFSVRHKFDNTKFSRWSKKELINALKLYLSQKIGMYRYTGRPSFAILKRIIEYYGLYSLFILSFPVIYYLVPTSFLKLVYRKRLQGIYGKEKSQKIYKENIRRAIC